MAARRGVASPVHVTTDQGRGARQPIGFPLSAGSGPTIVRPPSQDFAQTFDAAVRTTGRPLTPGRSSVLNRAIAGDFTGQAARAVRDAFSNRPQPQGAPAMPFDPYASFPSTSTPGGGQPGSGVSITDLLARLGNAAIDRYLGPREQAQNSNLTSSGGCPGLMQVKVGGKCVDLTALPPGGDPATYPAQGSATMGVFGAPALAPYSEAVPTLRCPTGLVLGKDNLCYAKGSIPNKWRKWPKSARPPVSAHDAKMMRKYGPGGSKQKSIKTLATNAGFTCKKR